MTLPPDPVPKPLPNPVPNAVPSQQAMPAPASTPPLPDLSESVAGEEDPGAALDLIEPRPASPRKPQGRPEPFPKPRPEPSDGP